MWILINWLLKPADKRGYRILKKLLWELNSLSAVGRHYTVIRTEFDRMYRPLIKSGYQKINFLISQPKHML